MMLREVIGWCHYVAVVTTTPPLHLSGVSECRTDTHWLFYLHPHEEPLRLISEPMNNIKPNLRQVRWGASFAPRAPAAWHPHCFITIVRV